MNNQNKCIGIAVTKLNAEVLKPLFDVKKSPASRNCRPRSLASMQLRALSAVKTLLSRKAGNVLTLTVSDDVDALNLACELVSLCGKEAYKIASASKKELFGKKNDGGLLAKGGIFVLPCVLFLEHPRFFSKCAALLQDAADLKLIFCGSAQDCADLMLLWPEFESAMHTDTVLEFPTAPLLCASLIAHWCKKGICRHFNAEAVAVFTVFCNRLASDRRWMYLQERLLKALCEDASSHCRGNEVRAKDFLHAVAAHDFRQNYVASAQIRDHREEQILMRTSGKCPGQINALSVIETSGTCYEYGEPVRVTACIRAGGDGEVIDIERKAELAGQIHAKAMMIINGFIMREFGSVLPMPASASLVFEQSYSAIDGDSASLTGLCAVLSAYGDLPLRQDLAVTGAVDQFGNVQPVGGVNQKIEGFFRICSLHGLTGTQGVIIPKSCVYSLVLRPSVLKAVASGRFHIYTVTHVTNALELLTGIPWGDPETEGSIVQKVLERLESINSRGDERPWWHFWG